MNAMHRHKDPGLQPERTALAWARTTLSFSVASAVLLRWTWVLGAGTFLIVGLLVLVALFILLSQHQRYRRHNKGLKIGQTPPNISGIFSLGLAASTLGIVAIFLILRH